MYTSPCTAPAPHSAPVLTSTDPHEPMAKQQTTEPSPCQSKFLACLPIICKPCYKASTKAYIHRNELACTFLQDIQAYPLAQLSLHQSMYPFMYPIQPLSPTVHQWWVSHTPWPSSLQQGHHIISVSVNSAFDHWIFHCFSWTML